MLLPCEGYALGAEVYWFHVAYAVYVPFEERFLKNGVNAFQISKVASKKEVVVGLWPELNPKCLLPTNSMSFVDNPIELDFVEFSPTSL